MERRHFTVFTSVETERELRRGVYPGQKRAIAEALKLPYLALVGEVREMAERYVSEGFVPDSKDVDAQQLAISVFYGIDYLLSWNYAHLVNPGVQQKLSDLNKKMNLRTPLLVSPESIPRVYLGQEIRRRD